jgi:hypothetical protein
LWVSKQVEDIMEQKSISAGHLNTAGPDRNQGKHWLVYAGGTIAAGQVVHVSGSVNNAPSVVLAGGLFPLSTRCSLFVATHGGVSGQPVRLSKVFMLNGQDTSSAPATGVAVYLSDTAGGWSLTPGTYKRRIGTVVVKSATVGSILLDPNEYGANAVDVVGNTAASTAIDGTQEALTSFDVTRIIKGGRLRVGSQIRIRAIGTHTATTGAETHDMNLILGSIVLASKTGIDPANNDIFMFDILVQVRTIGASGTLVAMGTMTFGALGVASPVAVLKASTAVDTTADLTAAVQIDRQAAAADTDSARLEILSVDIID